MPLHYWGFWLGVCQCHRGFDRKLITLTSLPWTIRWCVVTKALNTTTQLLFVARSKSVSAIWGIFTFVSLVAWIKSVKRKKRKLLGATNKTKKFAALPTSQPTRLQAMVMAKSKFSAYILHLTQQKSHQNLSLYYYMPTATLVWFLCPTSPAFHQFCPELRPNLCPSSSLMKLGSTTSHDFIACRFSI